MTPGSVFHESDHELVLSTSKPNLNAVHAIIRRTIVPHHQTTNFPVDTKSQFRTSLSAVVYKSQSVTSVESSWSAFKSTINDVQHYLKPFYLAILIGRQMSQGICRRRKAMLDSVNYRNASKQGCEVSQHRARYKHYCNFDQTGRRESEKCMVNSSC